MLQLDRTPIVSLVQSREIDRCTILDYHIPDIVLMEEAAERIFSDLIYRFRHHKTKLFNKISIIVYPGNNGADLLSIARKLYLNGFTNIELFILQPDKIKEDSLFDKHYKVINSLSMSINSLFQDYEKLKESSLIIDGLFGTGFRSRQSDIVTSKLHISIESIIDFINSLNKPIISIDIPSALDSVKKTGLKACFTYSIGFYKQEFYNIQSRAKCGSIKNIPISFVFDPVTCKYFHIDRIRFKYPDDRFVNKYSRGGLMVIGGGHGTWGAVCYSINAAYSVGSGIVCLLTEETDIQTVNPMLKNTVIAGFDNIDDHISKYNTILIGPGLKLKNQRYKLIESILRQKENIVIDASFFTLFDCSILDRIKSTPIVTPHTKEFSVFFNIDIETLKQDTINIVSMIASKYKIFIVLKDQFITVGMPDGTVNVYDKQVRIAAQAGSGDILAGIIAGFLSQTGDPAYSIYAGIESFYRSLKKISINKILSYNPDLLLEQLRMATNG